MPGKAPTVTRPVKGAFVGLGKRSGFTSTPWQTKSRGVTGADGIAPSKQATAAFWAAVRALVTFLVVAFAIVVGLTPRY